MLKLLPCKVSLPVCSPPHIEQIVQLVGLREAVAFAAYGINEFWILRIIEFLTKPGDVHVDGLRGNSAGSPCIAKTKNTFRGARGAYSVVIVAASLSFTSMLCRGPVR